MKKAISLYLIYSLSIVWGFIFCSSKNTTPLDKIPTGLTNLLRAYPDFLAQATPTALIWKDGTVMPYDDGELKTMDTVLVRPDLEEQMRYQYRKGNWGKIPDTTDEAGRIRFEPFFKKMYGGTAEEVKSKLSRVEWLPGVFKKKNYYKFNSVNHAAENLQLVSNELALMPSQYHVFLKNIGGTFNWRTISGSTRLSNHSFGIAIDINVKYSNYWDWEKDATGCFAYSNKIPYQIAEIFEKHGFIWGGKWFHHDTMHFEYRPELLLD